MSAAQTAASRQVWSVSEFVGISRDLLLDAMPFIWVRGEITGLSRPSSGHWYFDLKDDKALVPVAMFGRANSQVAFDVEEGMEIIVGGEVTIYPLRGKFQIVAEILEPVGWGALQLAYEQLKARLAEEGLFAPERKKTLPTLPQCVGVVTSPTGAAWRDMRKVWHDNAVPIEVLLAPAQVQGNGAAQSIVAAIERLDRHGRADVIIVGRGGGSREDLWAFNEEPVARAIAAAKTPVVAAVGHEVDHTIADFVADHRAATPTAAAELVAASRTSLVRRVEAARQRSHAAISQKVLRASGRMLEPGLQRSLRQPGRLVSIYRQRLDDSFFAVRNRLERRVDDHRLTLQDTSRLLSSRNLSTLAARRRARAVAAAAAARASILRILDKRKGRLAAAVARIEALSPLAVLGRGYSICSRSDDGEIVRAAPDVAPGDAVRVRLAHDTLDCTVESTESGTTPTSL